jgi:hypothetical protein
MENEMKKLLTFIAVVMFFASSPAHAFIGQSKPYKVESDFGITGPSEMVVFPSAFQLETKEVTFYVPFTAIDYTRLENKTITVSMNGKIITIKVSSTAYATTLYKDLTKAISGEFLDKD